MDNEKRTPTLESYIQSLNVPVYLLNPQTPVESVLAWYREQEEKYYQKYGKETIESTRVKKEGE